VLSYVERLKEKISKILKNQKLNVPALDNFVNSNYFLLETLVKRQEQEDETSEEPGKFRIDLIMALDKEEPTSLESGFHLTGFDKSPIPPQRSQSLIPMSSSTKNNEDLRSKSTKTSGREKKKPVIKEQINIKKRVTRRQATNTNDLNKYVYKICILTSREMNTGRENRQIRTRNPRRKAPTKSPVPRQSARLKEKKDKKIKKIMTKLGDSNLV
jgi:hypothetical protein